MGECGEVCNPKATGGLDCGEACGGCFESPMGHCEKDHCVKHC